MRFTPGREGDRDPAESKLPAGNEDREKTSPVNVHEDGVGELFSPWDREVK